MHLRGQSSSVHLGSVFRLLYHYQEYSFHIPDVFPSLANERLRQMGQGASGYFQYHTGKTTEQYPSGRRHLEQVYGPGEGACKNAV